MNKIIFLNHDPNLHTSPLMNDLFSNSDGECMQVHHLVPIVLRQKMKLIYQSVFIKSIVERMIKIELRIEYGAIKYSHVF